MDKRQPQQPASPSAPKRRTGGRSARIRQAVMDATMDMLRDEDIESFNVAAIASQVGVHESTIYRRWGSRDGLIIETVLTRMNETIPLPDTGDFRGDIRAFLQASASFLESPLGRLLTRSAFSTMSQQDSQARQMYWAARVSHTGLLVERAVARGEIAPDVAPEAVLTALIGALYVRMLFFQAPLDAAFLDQLAQIVLDGVMLRR